MTDQFDHWQRLRDQKNKIATALSTLLDTVPQSPDEAEAEAALVGRYNDLYEAMDAIETEFTEADWEAYEQDQADIREAQRQAWLIQHRYGSDSPSTGISDWWTTSSDDEVER